MFINKKTLLITLGSFAVTLFCLFNYKEIAQACCATGGLYKDTGSCYCEFGGANNCNAGGGIKAQGKRWNDWGSTFTGSCEGRDNQYACGSVDDSTCCAVACGGNSTCEDTPPTQAPPLFNPAPILNTVTLNWGSITEWGHNCGELQKIYNVYVKSATGVYTLIPDANRTDLTAQFTGVIGQTYQWKVVPNNGVLDGPFNEGSFTFTPPPCVDTAPTQAPSLIKPSPILDTVTLNWGSITGWGFTCGPLQKNYNVYVKSDTGVYTLIPDATRTDLTAQFTGIIGQTYKWKVVPNNGVLDGPFNEGQFTFTTKVQGYIWNSDLTGSCASQGSKATEIQPPSSASVSAGGVAGVWDTGFSGHSYEVTNVQKGDQVVCATVTNSDPNFSWRLNCLNSTNIGSVGSGCVTVPVDANVVTANLGFEPFSKGWYKGVNGDVYAHSISAGVPKDSQILGGFTSHLGGGMATVLSAEDISVINTLNEPRIAESRRVAKYINTSNSASWLAKFSYREPSNVTPIDLGCSPADFRNLDPQKVYRISSTCLNTVINRGVNVNYTLRADGVAVVYVYDSGNSTITFGKNNRTFKAQLATRKILFVIGDEIKTVIDSRLGVNTIDTDTQPQLQFGLITNGEIVFESRANPSGVEDTSVLLEGLLVSYGGISFDRDRGLNNGYPAEVIKFDPIYIDKIATQEMLGLVSGVSTFHVIWDLGD